MKKTICGALAAVMLISGGFAESADRQLRIEKALYELGYRDEHYDNTPDDDTVSALRAFQKANRLPVTGEADDATYNLLFSGNARTPEEYLQSVANSYGDQALLQKGSTGDTVTALQNRLTELGYFTGTCDGIFGDETRQGVCRFERANGLSESGTVDAAMEMLLYEGTPLTWDAFLSNMSCAVGDEGANVRTLQRKLRTLGWFDGDCTGSFGTMTQRAVCDYQRANSLDVTGEADTVTCNALYWDTVSAPDEASEAQTASLLEALGYPGSNETALKLFQSASGLEMTGEADDDTLAALDAEDAVSYETAHESLAAKCVDADEDVRQVLADTATGYLGHAFQDADATGFTFVQQVCLDSGLPLPSAEDILSFPRQRVEDYSQLQPGDIVVFQRTDGDWTGLLYAVCTRPGFVAYASSESPYALESSVTRLATDEVSAWTPGTAVR